MLINTPQEVQVWFILPALRRIFALELKKKGLKQKKIAELLNLSEGAVSQYLKGKRGLEVKFTQPILEEITASCSAIQDRKDALYHLQKVFKIIMETGFMCVVCQDHLDTAKGCNICFR